MRIRELRIRNFRKIENLTVAFPKGLSVIVGENNTGKTTIIDALRLMLMPARDFDALRITEDDFRSGTDGAQIEISCTFCDTTDIEEAHCQECLVDIGDGKFEICINARVEFNKDTRRANVKMWGGETEGGSLPLNFFDRLATIYLQPLRDPESGLRPGRTSQISRLVDCLTQKDTIPIPSEPTGQIVFLPSGRTSPLASHCASRRSSSTRRKTPTFGCCGCSIN